jgi:hypothetical protein
LNSEELTNTSLWAQSDCIVYTMNFSQITNYTVLCATVYCKFITSSLLK